MTKVPVGNGLQEDWQQKAGKAEWGAWGCHQVPCSTSHTHTESLSRASPFVFFFTFALFGISFQ